MTDLLTWARRLLPVALLVSVIGASTLLGDPCETGVGLKRESRGTFSGPYVFPPPWSGAIALSALAGSTYRESTATVWRQASDKGTLIELNYLFDEPDAARDFAENVALKLDWTPAQIEGTAAYVSLGKPRTEPPMTLLIRGNSATLVTALGFPDEAAMVRESATRAAQCS